MITPGRLHWPANSLRAGPWALELTPERAGWSCAGLRVAELAAGGRIAFSTGGAEMAVLPLAGSLEVEVDGHRLALAGRHSVFSAVTDWAYLPIEAEVALASAGGCSVAVPFAPASRRFEPVRVAAAEVAVEVRGAGSCTRQVTNFMSPEHFPSAERLMCVEVLTPDGNWSSYPPHKHDDSPECPVNNEEIYYFRVGRVGSTEPCAAGLAAHRTYTTDRSIDECVAVADGDVFCVPRGYHGPSMAAPGYPLYYLNVLASPGDVRSMAFCDDPDHHWVRERWAAERPDPRCPMTQASEQR